LVTGAVTCGVNEPDWAAEAPVERGFKGELDEREKM
jgi:hypothetical protein